MSIPCWHELTKYGAVDILRREYGTLLLSQPEPEYNVSLQIDLEQAPSEIGTCPQESNLSLLIILSLIV